MARLAILSPLPPGRSDAALAGASLVWALRRLGGHDVSAAWPLPESVEALLNLADLAVYHVAGDPEDREIYELAVDRPGLVVLHDLALERLIRAGLAARDPVAVQSAREALAAYDLLEDVDPGEALRVPWVSYLLRRARGVVVHSSFAARYLQALGTRTPVFVAPPPAVLDRRPLRAARRRARRLRASFGREKLVGVIGRQGAGLGLDTAIAAAGRLGAHPVVMGEARFGEDAGAGSHPTPALNVPDRELTGWVAACDVVVDLDEPPTGAIPIPVVRALQLGVPLVVASTEALPDGTDAGVRLTGGGDVDAVTEAVERAVHDRATAERGRLAAERLAAAAPAAYRAAVEQTLALVTDPVEWTLARWADALLDSGVAADGVSRGYGTIYTDALEELRPA